MSDDEFDPDKRRLPPECREEWRSVKVYDKTCTRCRKRMTYRHKAWESYSQNDTLIRLCNECYCKAGEAR